MKKISTLFKKNPENLGRVIDEINPENQWVFDGEGISTRKFDGTACAIFDGKLYKRYDVKLFKKKKGKIIYFTAEQLLAKIPEEAIECQKADAISGHWPHWILCDRNNPENKYHFEGFDKFCLETPPEYIDGTYELCGPKIQSNPEKFNSHKLVPHGIQGMQSEIKEYTFEFFKSYLSNPDNDIEGIVFHHQKDERMCKIRKSDFGIKR